MTKSIYFAIITIDSKKLSQKNKNKNKTMENIMIKANTFDFSHIGWKYYNQIKKKAMEQEFSWSGLILSLSIAFFIVIISSIILGLAYKSLEKINFISNFLPDRIYQFEGIHDYSIENYLQSEYISKDKIEQIRTVNFG